MDRRTFIKTVTVGTMAAASVSSRAQEKDGVIDLPPPEKEGGMSVLAALQARRTIRRMRPDPLPPQMLSNLLWAAFGVNREQAAFGKPGRTAASASNSQEIDLYVALPEGVFLYEAIPNRLKRVAEADLRGLAGRRGAATAPVNLFFVVDRSRYDQGPNQPDRRIGDPEIQKSYYYTDTGLIAQNVYLFAASQGLAAWFHNCDRDTSAREFGLSETCSVLFAQSVGYPAEA